MFDVPLAQRTEDSQSDPLQVPVPALQLEQQEGQLLRRDRQDPKPVTIDSRITTVCLAFILLDAVL